MDLGGTYANAIAQISRTVAISGEIPDLFRSSWSEVRRLCGASEKYAREAIVGTLVDTEGAVTDTFFEVFSDELFDANILRDQRRLVEKVLSPILSNHRINAIRWATKLLEKHPGFLAELQHADEFRDLLKSELERPDIDASAKEELDRLAVAAGLGGTETT
jgi:hypothetical protein